MEEIITVIASVRQLPPCVVAMQAHASEPGQRARTVCAFRRFGEGWPELAAGGSEIEPVGPAVAGRSWRACARPPAAWSSDVNSHRPEF